MTRKTAETTASAAVNFDTSTVTAIAARLPKERPDLDGLSSELRHLRLLKIGQEAGLWEYKLMDDQIRNYLLVFKGKELWLEPWEISGWILGVLTTLGLPTTGLAYKDELA